MCSEQLMAMCVCCFPLSTKMCHFDFFYKFQWNQKFENNTHVVKKCVWSLTRCGCQHHIRSILYLWESDSKVQHNIFDAGVRAWSMCVLRQAVTCVIIFAQKPVNFRLHILLKLIPYSTERISLQNVLKAMLCEMAPEGCIRRSANFGWISTIHLHYCLRYIYIFFYNTFTYLFRIHLHFLGYIYIYYRQNKYK